MSLVTEAERIRVEYARRAATIPADFYALEKPANLFMHQQRLRRALAHLGRAGMLPLHGRRILEVGCGTGGWLPDFEALGVRRGDLAGIDLDAARVEAARTRLGAVRDETGELKVAGADLRSGDATSLPWNAATFDIVVSSTVFSSVLDAAMRSAVAREMLRVLKPGGAVLWYDFFVDNPRNAHVRGVRRRELRALFPGCGIDLSRVTLAPPLARRLVPASWTAALLLESLAVLNTHYLALIRPR